MARKRKPEITLQTHIAEYLVREHQYGVLEQADITDTEHCIAQDRLWAFLEAVQSDTIQNLEEDCGTDVRQAGGCPSASASLHSANQV